MAKMATLAHDQPNPVSDFWPTWASSFLFPEKIKLDISCESSFKHNSHEMSSLVFSEKKDNKKISNDVCCSCDLGALRVNSENRTSPDI